ncbi:MAG TPA: hypothetical protein VMG38_01895 [Trebonia sp.]|nr:hypothetical protein [Trebonia sp.]
MIRCGARSAGRRTSRSQLTTLDPADIERFARDGYVVVRQAFSPADAREMERRWWRELADVHGIRRDDRSSWHQIAGDLKAAKRARTRPRFMRIKTQVLTHQGRQLRDRGQRPPS